MLATLDQFSRTPRILRLDVAGQPISWISWQDAVCLYARDLVLWSFGDLAFRIRGGVKGSTGKNSMVEVRCIIACDGQVYGEKYDVVPPLSNKALFARDRNHCMYCGGKFSDRHLTRDHVIPTSRGGEDLWTNVAAACRRCNIHKGNRLLHECDLELLALPYAPNVAEYLALINSGRILGDQLSFLESRFRKNGQQRRPLWDSILNPVL